MRKNTKSLRCPECDSNVEIISTVYEELPTMKFQYRDSNATDNRRIKYLNCKCKKCGNEFKFEVGKECYITFDVPPFDTQTEDVKLYIIYESEFNPDYKIYSIKNGSKEIFLMQIEDLDYPVLIPTEDILNITSNMELSNGFAYNHRMDRIR